ncbi:hypothetical protein ACA910_005593 [Epithemia clementina (nom. ined.)]
MLQSSSLSMSSLSSWPWKGACFTLWQLLAILISVHHNLVRQPFAHGFVVPPPTTTSPPGHVGQGLWSQTKLVSGSRRPTPRTRTASAVWSPPSVVQSTHFSTRMSSVTTRSADLMSDVDGKNWDVPQPNEGEENDNDDDTFVWTQQWYPILPADYAKGLNLDKKPLAFEMLDQKLVLWKSQEDDKYSVLLDTCPHRRAPLSTGKVVTTMNDSSNSSDSSSSSLACRYHGWEFNAQGTCTKLPMEPSSSSSKINRFRVPSYPVQEAGGMLWVFMDPYYLDQNKNKKLPELPVGATIPKDEFESDSSSIVWAHSSWPVSYLSMLENSFDPSHAPFVHEGVNSPGRGIKYSPHNAQPIQVYRLTTPLSAQEGFAVEHSPYLKAPTSNTTTGNSQMMTIRQFVPPCTNVVTSPQAFIGRLYFVPNSPTLTTTIGYFKVPIASRNMRRMKQLQNLLLPKQSWRDTLANWIHISLVLSDGRVRFGQQDSWTMQGQDERKLSDVRWGRGRRTWDDLIVSPSDAGVAALQKWMNKFGQGGPFPLHNLLRQSFSQEGGNEKDPTTMASMVTTLGSAAAATTTKVRIGPQFRSLSLWESHAKFCPQCPYDGKRRRWNDNWAKHPRYPWY